MHSLEILELNKHFWLPENLGECDRRQYLDMAKLIFMYQIDDINYEEFRVQAVYALLNLAPEESELPNAQEEKWENVYRISELIDSFFTEDKDKKKHLILDYTHNPVKSVKYLMRTFIGPKDGFNGITYGQFEDGVGELQNFIRYGEIESLVKLFAIFHLLKGENYQKLNIEKRVNFFKHLDIRHVYGFYLLFVSFFNYLTKDCILVVDGKEIDLRILFAGDGNSEKTESSDAESEALGLRSTSFQLAESGVFGTLKELRESDAMMVLIRMHDLIMRAKKEEQERKDQEEKAKSQT